MQLIFKKTSLEAKSQPFSDWDNLSRILQMLIVQDHIEKIIVNLTTEDREKLGL
ncbi:hypothetical protein HN784_01300 [bacterium]|nr:hypothetical protein [bacterium]MBT7431464.1 hypothetical protein [bacterium]